MNDTLSYVSGNTEVPLRSQTIGQALDEIAQEYGDRPALVVKHQNIKWSYQELNEQVDKFAAGLLSLGLQVGDRVGVWAPNCAEWIIAQYATARAGIIQVNINPAYRVHELEYVLNKVGCKALITADQFKSSDYIEMLYSLAPELKSSRPGSLKSEKLPQLSTLIRMGEEHSDGFLNFYDVTAKATEEDYEKLAVVAKTLKPDDAINIQFTSGTTGSPKGATLSHNNILNNAFFCGEAMKYSEEDLVCIPVPLYHCFGMVMGSLNCMTHAACMVFPNDGFDPESTLRAIDEEKCTSLYGVPTMFIAELDHPQFTNYDMSSLRTGCMAGASCPIEVMKKVFDEMNMSEVTIAYGMTETSPVSFQSSTDDPMEKRVSTVGRVHPHVEVKIINENGETVQRGEKGEFCTRGYCVMRGYWGDDERTAEAIDEGGWMHTGDLAILDDEGYCNIVGRVKDMVIRGGENVYPREIEEFLYTNEKIQDVSVFGVPDDKYGEEICAWVKLKSGSVSSEEEIRGFCKEKIAHYKVPRYIRFVEDFPMTVTGKIQKFIMRDKMKEELGIQEQQTA
ncbi:MAG: AMP-binding protein [Gammaproteobacteria bacterium]|nr:AMP-binding protein [Gammaproteobacteria bacterium]